MDAVLCQLDDTGSANTACFSAAEAACSRESRPTSFGFILKVCKTHETTQQKPSPQLGCSYWA